MEMNITKKKSKRRKRNIIIEFGVYKSSMNEEKTDRKTKESSTIIAIFKTVAFFAVLGGLGWFLLSYSSGKVTKEPDLQKDYRDVSFNELSNYDYYTPLTYDEPDPTRLAQNKIPEEIKAMSGKKISITGFMLPIENDENGRVSQFNLNGNYDMCFYGAPVMMNQWIGVKMKPGKTVPFSHKEVTIYGSLEIGEEKKDGVVVSIYRMEPDVVATVFGVVK